MWCFGIDYLFSFFFWFLMPTEERKKSTSWDQQTVDMVIGFVVWGMGSDAVVWSIGTYSCGVY